MTAASPGPRARGGAHPVALTLFGTEPTSLGTDVAAVTIRVALVWIFTYYGAGKLFGAFGGPGIHRTALFMSDTAHLHPGGLFAVLGGLIEFGGALALAFGLLARLAGLALLADQVMAMITVTWVHGIDASASAAGYGFNLALAAMALAIVGLGAGRPSLDSVIGRRLRPAGPSRRHGGADGSSSAGADRRWPASADQTS